MISKKTLRRHVKGGELLTSRSSATRGHNLAPRCYRGGLESFIDFAPRCYRVLESFFDFGIELGILGLASLAFKVRTWIDRGDIALVAAAVWHLGLSSG